MQKNLKTSVTIHSYECDMYNRWRPSALLEQMQEMAGNHAALLGVGREALIRQDIVWVLTRIQVEMDRWPLWGDTVEMETFPMTNRRWFFPRYFIIRDDKGDEIGRAGTLWTLMNIRDRKMAPPDCASPYIPDNRDRTAPLGLPPAVQELTEAARLDTYKPVYTDMDCNAHVNNTKYIDWCCNALGFDTMKDSSLREFSINYNHELLPGETVSTELRCSDGKFSYSGFVSGQRCFDIGGTLMPR